MEKLEKLRQEMLEARDLYKKFIEDHSRPMTAEERQKKSVLSDGNGEALGEQVSGPETYLLWLKTKEDIEEMQKLETNMNETHLAFVGEFKKKDWTHE